MNITISKEWHTGAFIVCTSSASTKCIASWGE